MIKRNIFLELKEHLNKKEIGLIVGHRQAGKTTLMSLLADDLNKQEKPALSLNYDIEKDREFFGSQEKLLKKIELEIGNKKAMFF